MIPQLLLIALGTLASEDLTCVATGVLIAQGKLSFAEGAFACFAGIVAGDLLLFLAGRVAGPRALRWPPLQRFLSPAMVQRGAEWLERRGLVVVILSRFTPGLRLPTYFAAGLLPTSASMFAAYFLLASAIWTPLAVGAAALAGEELLRRIFAYRDQGLLAFIIVFGIVALATRILAPLGSGSGRRRVLGVARRLGQWEFWPPWAAYLPLAPYLLYLAIRYRSLTVFTAANPGIPSGGFVGESKSDILRHLSRERGVVAEYAVISSGFRVKDKIQAARRFMARHNLDFPVVLKPDAGERGAGVAIVRSAVEMEDYLRSVATDLVIQRYIAGVEFGVFYYRYPHQPRGRIFSITRKSFPSVVGDGQRTLRELILRDPRAVCIATTYERLSKQAMDDVPAANQQVQLVEIGSHCRGAVFLDGSSLATPALEEAIDRISRAHPGFYFGRFDVRSPSVEAFQLGRFSVIELNGVSAEATHIYDPAVSLLEAYRVMFEQWRIAFEIGAANRARGARPLGVAALLMLVARSRFAKRTAGTQRNAPALEEVAG